MEESPSQVPSQARWTVHPGLALTVLVSCQDSTLPGVPTRLPSGLIAIQPAHASAHHPSASSVDTQLPLSIPLLADVAAVAGN